RRQVRGERDAGEAEERSRRDLRAALAGRDRRSGLQRPRPEAVSLPVLAHVRVKGVERDLGQRPVEVAHDLRIAVDRLQRRLVLPPPGAQHEPLGAQRLRVAHCSSGGSRPPSAVALTPKLPRWPASANTSAARPIVSSRSSTLDSSWSLNQSTCDASASLVSTPTTGTSSIRKPRMSPSSNVSTT